MFQVSRTGSPLDGVQGLVLLGAAIIAVPIGLITLVVWTVRLLSDPAPTTAETVTGIALALALAALPATASLLLSRRRADLAWVPAMVARRRTPFTPGPADLVLKQAPGRLVAGLAAGWIGAVGFLVLALGQHPAWWLALAAALAVIARLTWRLRTRPVLEISADGFEVRSGWRRVALAWDECAAFTATPHGQVQVQVVADLGLKPPPAHAIRRGLDHRSAAELAVLLTSYLPTGPVPPRGPPPAVPSAARAPVRQRPGGGSAPGPAPDPQPAGVTGWLFALVPVLAMALPGVQVATVGLRLLSDPQSGRAVAVTGAGMVLLVAALPAVGLLSVVRYRADRAWQPVIRARSRMPFTPATPELVLTQAPGRLVTDIVAGAVMVPACLVLAVGAHPAVWLAVAACLALVTGTTWRLVNRPVLAISADGFEIRSGPRRAALAWSECAGFTATPRGWVTVTVTPDLGLEPPPGHAIRTGLDHRSADDLARLLSSYLPRG